MAQDTFFKSQALTQPQRMQGERIAFAGAQSLGQGIGQAARNYVQTSQSEQMLAQRGAEGRVRMMTEQLRQDEIRQKMVMVEQGGALQMQQEQLKAMRLQNQQIETQMKREEEYGMSEGMQQRALGQVFDMGEGKIGMVGPHGMQEISSAQAQLMQSISGKGGAARTQDPGQSLRQNQQNIAFVAQAKQQLKLLGERSGWSQEAIDRLDKTLEQTLKAEGMPPLESAIEQGTEKLGEAVDDRDKKAANVVGELSFGAQWSALEGEHNRFDIMREIANFAKEAIADGFSEKVVREGMKDERFIQEIRERLGGG